MGIDHRQVDGRSGSLPPTTPSDGRSRIVTAAGNTLFPFPDQQRAKNISLAIEALVAAAVGPGHSSRSMCGGVANDADPALRVQT
jgi:hypothetical protein